MTLTATATPTTSFSSLKQAAVVLNFVEEISCTRSENIWLLDSDLHKLMAAGEAPLFAYLPLPYITIGDNLGLGAMY